jgi:hypothetical protein
MKTLIGKRVKVEIKEKSHYVSDAYLNLNGKEGEVVEEKKYKGNDYLWENYRVKFDTPAKPFCTYGTKHTSFWFPVENLVEL